MSSNNYSSNEKKEFLDNAKNEYKGASKRVFSKLEKINKIIDQPMGEPKLDQLYDFFIKNKKENIYFSNLMQDMSPGFEDLLVNTNKEIKSIRNTKIKKGEKNFPKSIIFEENLLPLEIRRKFNVSIGQIENSLKRVENEIDSNNFFIFVKENNNDEVLQDDIYRDIDNSYLNQISKVNYDTDNITEYINDEGKIFLDILENYENKLSNEGSRYKRKIKKSLDFMKDQTNLKKRDLFLFPDETKIIAEKTQITKRYKNITPGKKLSILRNEIVEVPEIENDPLLLEAISLPAISAGKFYDKNDDIIEIDENSNKLMTDIIDDINKQYKKELYNCILDEGLRPKYRKGQKINVKDEILNNLNEKTFLEMIDNNVSKCVKKIDESGNKYINEEDPLDKDSKFGEEYGKKYGFFNMKNNLFRNIDDKIRKLKFRNKVKN